MAENARSGRTRIDIGRKSEVDYWSKRLDAPAARIVRAVAAVGPRPADVGRYLRETQEQKRHPRRARSTREGAAKRGRPRSSLKSGWKTGERTRNPRGRS
jgi:hypothetical protein